MHAHGVDVFDGADDDEVVVLIAHYFEFKFFPAFNRFFNQRFVHRAGIERASDGFSELFAVVDDAAAEAAKRKRGTNHQRVAEFFGYGHCVLDAIYQRGFGHIETGFAAGILEPEAVFSDFDGAQRGAD